MNDGTETEKKHVHAPIQQPKIKTTPNKIFDWYYESEESEREKNNKYIHRLVTMFSEHQISDADTFKVTGIFL